MISMVKFGITKHEMLTLKPGSKIAEMGIMQVKKGSGGKVKKIITNRYEVVETPKKLDNGILPQPKGGAALNSETYEVCCKRILEPGEPEPRIYKNAVSYQTKKDEKKDPLLNYLHIRLYKSRGLDDQHFENDGFKVLA